LADEGMLVEKGTLPLLLVLLVRPALSLSLIAKTRKRLTAVPCHLCSDDGGEATQTFDEQARLTFAEPRSVAMTQIHVQYSTVVYM
jgi:hypothetical protein